MRVLALALTAILIAVAVAYRGSLTEVARLRQALTTTETQLAAARLDAATTKQRLVAQAARLKNLEERRDAIQTLELRVRFTEAAPADSRVDTTAAIEARTLHLFTRADLVGTTLIPLVTRDSARVERDGEGLVVSLTYELLDPDSWVGQPVPLLSTIQTLTIRSLPVLRKAGLRLGEGGTVATIEVFLNGSSMGAIAAPISFQEGDGSRGVVDVAQYFRGLPEAYGRTQQPPVP
jgi:hypothetical protein